MASNLRKRRVATRRLCEDRRQLLDLALLQLRDADRLQPKGLDLGAIDLFALDVKAILEAEKAGAQVDLGSEEFVHVSAAEDDRVELVSEFRLDGAQLSLAAYETLILFLRADGAAGRLPRSFSNPEQAGGDDVDDDEELLNEIRLNLMISTKQHRVVVPKLVVAPADLPLPMRDQAIEPTSLHYRFQMLAARRPEEFDDDGAFEKWQERQMAVFMMGLHGELNAAGLLKNGEPLIELQDCENTLDDLFQRMLDISRPDQGRIQTRKSEGFPVKEYAQCIEQINAFLCSIIYPQFAAHRRGGHGTCSDTPHAYPLNVVIYGKLFETCFDSENRGTFSSQGQRTLDFLTRQSFRDRLEITDQMHHLSYANALCTELSTTSAVDLMPMLKDQIFSILPDMALNPEDPTAPGADRWLVHTEREHRDSMLEALRTNFREVLFDYHAYHENVEKIAAYLQVYGFLEGPVAGGEPEPDRLVSDMILTCTIKNYNALAGLLERPMHPLDLAGIVEESLKQLQVELEFFSPVFRDLHPSPDAEYINILTKLISQDHTALIELTAIDDDVMVCLKEMEAFDDFINEYAKGDYGETLMERADLRQPMLQHASIADEQDRLEAWLRAPISGLLWKWIYSQESNFETLTTNLLAVESWEPITEGVHHSSSVTDMFAMFRQTMDFFFRLELAVPAFLNYLLGAMVGCLMKYANLMKQHQPKKGPPLELSNILEALVAHDPAIAKPTRVGSHDEISEIKQPIVLKDLPDPPMVCVRMCNVFNALKQFRAFVNDMTGRFTEILTERERAMPESAQQQLDSYVKGVETTFEDANFELQEFLGVLIVFGQDGLQRDLLQLCYTPSPRGCGLESTIQELEQMIDVLKEMVEPELVEDVVGGIKHSLLMGFERVLLDGGVNRVFDACDAEIFRRDLSLLIAFFGQDASAPMSIQNIPAGVNVTEPCVRCEQERACVFCADERCQTNYCLACDDEIHGGAWASHRRHVYALTKKVRSMIELIDVLLMPTAELLELYADPQAAVGMGGAFAQKRWRERGEGSTLELLTKVLVHRDDELAIEFGKRYIEGYETGGVLRGTADGVTKVGKVGTSVGVGLIKGTMRMGKGATQAFGGRYRGADDDGREDLDEYMDDYGAEPEPEDGGAARRSSMDDGDLRIDLEDTKQKFKSMFKSAKEGTEKFSQLARDSFAVEEEGAEDAQARAAAAMAEAHGGGGAFSRLGRLGRK